MRRTTLALGVLAVSVGAAIVAACGANSSDDGGFTGGAGSAGAAGQPGTGGFIPAGSGGSGSQDAAIFQDVFVSDSSEMPDGMECVAQKASGEVWPLDMYIMMDQSGSMSSTINLAGTITKWKAVTEGLGAFFNAQPASADLGVGIQFFPLPVKQWDTMTKCTQNGNECPDTALCTQVDIGTYCLSKCTSDAACGGAECVSGGGDSDICLNDSCDANVYANPEVAVGMLSTTKAGVLASMAAHGPLTMTPTVPALAGAIQYAKAYAPQHPERKVIVVFATDGMPTECPADNQPTAGLNMSKQIATKALTENPSIKTFVIGVVDMGDWMSTNNLNALAKAGGTDTALIVKPNQDMATQFSTALEKIKGKAVGCEFKIPVPEAGKVDPAKVNVVYKVNGGADEKVYKVADASKCSATTGGWYYDNPVDPSAIILCPKTCEVVQTPSQKVDVSMQLGCETWIDVPK